MKISVLSPYPPLSSGIGEFCFDMLEAIQKHDPSLQVMLYPLEADNKMYEYTYQNYLKEGMKVIKQDQKSFINAAESINKNDSDLCIVQHEYNLFGGETGSYIIEFATALQKPLIVILHTIPINKEDPQFQAKKDHLLKLDTKTAAYITMTEAGKKGLIDLGISDKKVQVILHGAPEFPKREKIPDIKLSLGLENSFVVTEFGIMRPSKGIELFIQTAALVAPIVPQAQFLIIGQQDTNGPQEYFEKMKQIVADLNLSHVVRFIDNFFHRDILFQYLMASDAIITPYQRFDKISSGVLTFALAAGVPVVATPYLAAEELLKDIGTITSATDPQSVADEIIALATNQEYYQKRQQDTERKGSTMSWYEKGKEYYMMLSSYVEKNRAH